MNVTYWLDFGTLLGAMRNGDIIRYDGDADISRIYPEGKKYSDYLFTKKLMEKGIEGNAIIATYKDVTVDLHKWDIHKEFTKDGTMHMIVKRWYSTRRRKENPYVNELYDKTVIVPLSWILPTRRVRFLGIEAKIPNNVDEFLNNRFSFTYKLDISVPYKWKCWIPFIS
ncbi:uncharacterized protein RT0683-like [Saccoglossus kowalevskii]